MNWILYFLLYCGICYVVFTCVYVYNMLKGKEIIDKEPKVKILLFLVVTPLLPILYPVFFVSDRIAKRKEAIRKREEEKKENEFKDRFAPR